MVEDYKTTLSVTVTYMSISMSTMTLEGNLSISIIEAPGPGAVDEGHIKVRLPILASVSQGELCPGDGKGKAIETCLSTKWSSKCWMS